MIPRRPRIHVDDAGLDDADVFAEIHGAAFTRTWSGDDFAALLVDPVVFALALRRRSLFGATRLVGFVLARVAANQAEILAIAVRPRSRGRGYGRMLMEEALRRLYRERVATCLLEVDRDNRAAVRLYRSLGFTVTGERQRYHPDPRSGDDTALVMRLQLR